MGIIKDLIDYVTRIFTWWITIMPWEEGLRVRLGKRITRMKSGVYLKIPIIDSCYVQTTRMRVIALPVQTMTTLDGKTISLVATGGYSIGNIDLLYNTLYHPEATITNIIMGAIAQYVATNNYIDCIPAKIEDNVNEILKTYDKYGLENITMGIIGFAVVKTYRLIQDGHYLERGMSLDQPIK